MKTHHTHLRSAVAAAGLAAAALLAMLALTGAPAAAAKPKIYECQHPVVTGMEAVNPKGVTPQEACKVVRSLGKFLSKPANIRKLYECKGAGGHTPVLKMDEFEGWKLKLQNYNFIMYKPGASFRVTGTDFPVNCS
ncbi:MAG: hypothetical protein JST08_15630 [Actinobacteria bacterium]|nr:hypothetical protein [Actinomycetota bacterium]